MHGFDIEQDDFRAPDGSPGDSTCVGAQVRRQRENAIFVDVKATSSIVAQAGWVNVAVADLSKQESSSRFRRVLEAGGKELRGRAAFEPLVEFVSLHRML